MDILIEDTQSTYHILDVDVGSLCMVQQLSWLVYVDCVEVIKWSKEGFSVVVVLHHLFVDCEDGIELFHDDIDVQDGLGGGFEVVDWEKVVEWGEMLEVVLDVWG